MCSIRADNGNGYRKGQWLQLRACRVSKGNVVWCDYHITSSYQFQRASNDPYSHLLLQVVASLAVILRLYTRLRVFKKPGWDDATIALAFVSDDHLMPQLSSHSTDRFQGATTVGSIFILISKLQFCNMVDLLAHDSSRYTLGPRTTRIRPQVAGRVCRLPSCKYCCHPLRWIPTDRT